MLTLHEYVCMECDCLFWINDCFVDEDSELRCPFQETFPCMNAEPERTGRWLEVELETDFSQREKKHG